MLDETNIIHNDHQSCYVVRVRVLLLTFLSCYFVAAAELKRVGLEDSPEDINVVIYDEDEKRYPMEPSEEFDSDVLSEFVSEFKAGER